MESFFRERLGWATKELSSINVKLGRSLLSWAPRGVIKTLNFGQRKLWKRERKGKEVINMDIYRYIIDCYYVPAGKVDANGNLVDCTMHDIKNDYAVYKHEFLSTDYNPKSAVSSGKESMKADAGFKWIFDAVDRQKLDAFEKNLEFCERAELSFDGFEEKYPDMWDYLYWVVDNLIREEFEETLKAIKDRDIGQVIDGACDIQVLAANLPYKLFRKLHEDSPTNARNKTKEAFNRVVNSNLKKLDGAFMAIFRADGKVMKPDGWVEPKFDDLINDGD